MQRIQCKRDIGWRTPAGAVYVGNFTQWASPYEIYIYGAVRAVVLYRQKVARMSEAEREAWLAPLRQASALMCWCGGGRLSRRCAD
jgi:Domain of unknown function (DUF4326)